MAYFLDVSDEADRKFKKLGKKYPLQLEIINKKIVQILENPQHFKPLKGDMHGARRVHIDRSFVLTFEINEKEKIVRILDYDHHDRIY
jgi:YafQ family addiction module toxin component